MIWAFLRSESVQPVIDSLKKNGICGLTRMNLSKGSRNAAIGESAVPDTTIPDEMIMVVLPDNDVAKAVIAIRTAIKSGTKTNHPGENDDESSINGRILVTYVEDIYTIRDARKQTGYNKYEKDHCNYPE